MYLIRNVVNMCCGTLCIFIFLVSTTCGLATMTIRIGGSLDFGPHWQYDNHGKEMRASIREPEKSHKAIDKEILDKVQEYFGPKIVDTIVKGNEAKLDAVRNDEVYNNLEKNYTKEQIKKYRKTIREQLVKLNKQYASYFNETSAELVKSNEHNMSPTITDRNESTTVGNIRKLVRASNEITEEYTDPPKYRYTILEQHKSKKRKQMQPIKDKSNETIDLLLDDKGSVVNNKFTKLSTIDEIKTDTNSVTKSDIYSLRETLVKDDPKIKEFTKHVYEQSIKVFENIKDQMSDDAMKREADRLMRSYEEKFGAFVRETQNQRIKTRQGSEKVILNTLDTSNQILDRLVNYFIGNMDNKGVLRNAGVENVLLNELNKKKELENKHICNKLAICRSNESFTSLVIDLLVIVLNSSDKKLIEIRDAVTEVLKYTDFSGTLDVDTEKRFKKGLKDIEKYNVDKMRPLFTILKNALSSRNKPIKVVGHEDSRVNKTLSFLDIIDSWDKKLPPNEKNALTWNDIRNSLKEWSEGKRSDIVEIVQSFTDHVLATKTHIGRSDANSFDRNINTILGY